MEKNLENKDFLSKSNYDKDQITKADYQYTIDNQRNKIQQKELPLKQSSKLYSKSFIQIVPIVVTFCLSSFYFGYTIVFMSSLNIEHIQSLSLTQGLSNGLMSLGAGLGCILTKKFMQRFSRKNSILITNLIGFIAGFIIYIPNETLFFIVRVTQGICIGLYSALVPNYISQFSPLHLKGTFGAFVQLSLTLGTVYALFFTYVLSQIFNDYEKQYIWLYVFGFTQITILIQTLLIVFVYPLETPKYLILKGMKQDTMKLLKYLYHEDCIDKVYNQLERDIIEYDNEKQIKIEIEQPLIKIQQEQSKLKNLRKTPNIAIFTAFFMSFSQQMYGMGAVIIYGGQTMSESFPEIKNLIGLIINSPLIIASFILSYLLSKYQPKTILQIGTLSLSLMNLVISIGFLTQSHQYKNIQFSSYLILIGEISYNLIYAISAGAMLWVYMPVIVQPEILPYSTLFNWISSALVLMLFPVMVDYMPDKNPGYLFIFFALYTFMCFFVYMKFIIEIKDKTETQIHQEYTNMKIKCFNYEKEFMKSKENENNFKSKISILSNQ